MEGWRQRRPLRQSKDGTKLFLTPTGFLMEGVYTTVRRLFALQAIYAQNPCYGLTVAAPSDSLVCKVKVLAITDETSQLAC